MSYELDPAIAASGGNYWTREGIETVLGDHNLVVAANLQNESRTEDADTTARIVADGTLADAYTDFRARRGSRGQYAEDGDTPIPDTDADFALIRQATNLYAAYQLVRHRVWLASDQAATNQAMIDLKGEADDLYTQIFGDVESHNPDQPKPGTMVSVDLNYDPECTCNEFSSNC